uniref:CUB domain-containing protein n=1 Tax=Cyprinodon variegatus TaxID=28743 RepID=A0A3Q2CYT2_CYPVA
MRRYRRDGCVEAVEQNTAEYKRPKEPHPSLFLPYSNMVVYLCAPRVFYSVFILESEHTGPGRGLLVQTTSNILTSSTVGEKVPAPRSIRAFRGTMGRVLPSPTSLADLNQMLFVPAGCGGPVTAPAGEIHSPLYPASYPNNVDCSWVISVEVSHRVLLNFTDLDIEYHTNCTWDYVEIHDGSSASFPLLSRVCGSSTPQPITSTTNTIYVRFRSDSSSNHRGGFRAVYSASTSSCGGDLVMQSGAFNSPNYPDAYPPNMECVWTLRSSPGNRIQLSFLMFHLQGSCQNDYLEIREANSSGPVVGRFCGAELPSNYTSVSAHILWVKFVSDESVSGAGFRATFSHGECSTPRTLSDQSIENQNPSGSHSCLVASSSSGACGGLLMAGSAPAFLFSPEWPEIYPPSQECTWLIRAADSIVELNILSLDVEGFPPCLYDSLIIRDVLASVCGRDPPGSIHSSGDSMFIHFSSDSSIGGRGFNASFSKGSCFSLICSDIIWVFSLVLSLDYLHQTCGGFIVVRDEDPPGYITSPNYPENYPQNVDCIWVITVPNGEAVQVDFEDFYIEPTSRYRCSGSGSLSLPKMFDFSQSHQVSCSELVPGSEQVPGVLFMLMMFGSVFIISCSYDYLELRDGSSLNSDPISRLCGSTRPSTQHSKGSSMLLRFRTDTSVTHKGFKARYSIGGTMT